MKLFHIILIFLNVFILHTLEHKTEKGQCSIEQKAACADELNSDGDAAKSKYEKVSNIIWKNVQTALKDYVPCSPDQKDVNCTCYANVIERDLQPYRKDGITREIIEESSKFGTHYKILDKRLYRSKDCMFPARCSGIEHFLRKLLDDVPNVDMVVNTRDWPQLRPSFGMKGVVFSFSKTKDYSDIMYPAWTFWAGGPAISLHPTGIGRWDQMRKKIAKAATQTPWKEKHSKGFFRGSRTSDERDSLVLLSRRQPEFVDAQYTKNQAWKSPKDTLNAEPASEVSFEDHCRYKYLFNFRGVAASFRFKHLFLCKSLVFHVGNDWNEFFYFGLKPWVHYVPLKSYPSAEEIEQLLAFFRQNDELAQEIANRGYEFIWHHLRMQDVECYWRRLIQEYQPLLRYEVTSNSDLIEI